MKPLVIFCYFLAILGGFPVNAQELEEIIVTAQRREQSLQNVALSVTAFTGNAIEKTNINSAIDYLTLTPNVSFTEDGQAGSRGLGIAVRGVNNLVSGENAVVNSVGIYLDEFSIASIPSQVANPFIPDMERIEVLRGPQGTYFGRNSLGGAINITTKNPTDEFGWKVIAGAEYYEDSNEQFNVTGILNTPISDTLKVRVVVYFEKSGGLVDNICASGASASECPIAIANGFTPNGTDDSGHAYFMGRFKAMWDVSDQTTIGVTVIYADEAQGTDENVPSGILDVDTVDTFAIQAAVDPGTGFWPNNRNRLSHDYDESTDNKSLVAILNIKHQINDHLVLKSISGVIEAELERHFDNDLFGGVDDIRRDNLYEGISWSTELRLESTTEAMDWVVGVLYYQDDQEQENLVNTGPGATRGDTFSLGACDTTSIFFCKLFDPVGNGYFIPPFPNGLGLAFNSKNFEVSGIAVFADMTFHMTENMDLIAGGRFTHDIVTNDLMEFGVAPDGSCACGPGPGFFESFVNVPRDPIHAKEVFNDFSPRLGVHFQITDDLGLYATVSKGYKAGGESPNYDTSVPGNPGFTLPFKEETVWSYEFGLKSEWFGRRMRLNGAIFYLDWNDMQFETFRSLQPGILGPFISETINIKNAEAKGGEIEFLAIPAENFTISGAIGYINTEIISPTIVALSGAYNVKLKGLDVPKAPKITANVAGEYRWPIGKNEAWLRLEFIHRDGQYSDIEALTNRQTRGPAPSSGLSRPVGSGEFPYRTPDYDLLNLRAGYEAEGWSIVGYIQNLTDEKYYTGTQENFGVSGIRLRPHPRVFGVRLSYSFAGVD